MPVAPYGSWRSPITSELIVSGSISLLEVSLAGNEIYWIEGRPLEAGRRAIVRRAADGTTSDVNAPPFNARTRVHEYGGGAYVVAGASVVASSYADQRLYRIDPDREPRPLTPDTEQAALRYADATVDPSRGRLICVREDHRGAATEADAVNALVAVDLDGASLTDGGRVLVEGNDFYAAPRLSPDGDRLAWLTWNHPNMPWDGTALWVADVAADGSLGHARLVAGGETESIFQPQWSPDGVLHFVSDRTGWWNLYRWQENEAVPLAPMEAEFGLPQWVFRQSTYAFAGPRTIVCAFTQEGSWRLARLDPASRTLSPIATPFTEIDDVQAGDGFAVFTGGSPTEATRIVRLDLRTGALETLRSAASVDVDRGYLSTPRSIAYRTQDGQTAYGFHYPPRNRDFAAPDGELPPLVVLSHGGPTGATSTGLDLAKIHYWTSRGFAVLDVNYGGSTGYGRPYRERLLDKWGIVDVDDCVDGARALVNAGLADPNRLIIRGWSASGYTTLAALTFREVFKAGASHYGIGDLEALTRDTHKFESRYLDRLIGPYPDRIDRYRERSPVHYVHRMTAPLILFQGLEDKVVPPNQAETMFAAVKAKGLPVALVLFEGEQHGFRQAPNIRRALDGELFFLSRVFGFDLAEPIEPIEIANLPT